MKTIKISVQKKLRNNCRTHVRIVKQSIVLIDLIILEKKN